VDEVLLVQQSYIDLFERLIVRDVGSLENL